MRDQANKKGGTIKEANMGEGGREERYLFINQSKTFSPYLQHLVSLPMRKQLTWQSLPAVLL